MAPDCGEYGHAEGACGNASCMRPDNDSDEARLAQHRRLHSTLPEGYTPPPSRAEIELHDLRTTTLPVLRNQVTNLRAALQALADENWLDADPTDTPFLALAKDHARRALQ